MNTKRLIQWVGVNDQEISFEEIAQMAFDLNTPEALSIHYRQTLSNVEDILASYSSATMDRLIFLINPKTKRIRIWFD